MCYIRTLSIKRWTKNPKNPNNSSEIFNKSFFYLIFLKTLFRIPNYQCEGLVVQNINTVMLATLIAK